MNFKWSAAVITAMILTLTSAFGQQKENDAVLMRINGEPIYKSDFLYVYNKNNNNPQVIDPKSVDEYLELFINFNLKVKEAVSLGMDTLESFKKELAGYRKQLAQPYLSDTEVTERLIQEAWERMQTDLRASHILFVLPENSLPKDTLRVYEKAMKARNRILAGEEFALVARELSEDPSARDMAATAQRPGMPGNNGDLGYFSALDMVYPFENGAYALNVGEISMPVRSSFGYHIIKLTDRTPAMGKVRVAHIMVNAGGAADPTRDAEIIARINEIYAKVEGGEDFVELARKYSDDRGTAQKGGELPWFGVNRMVPEFIAAIKELQKPGDFTKPLKTAYGWHIVKLLEQKKPLSLEDEYVELKNRVGRDSRSRLSQESIVGRLKKEYSYKEDAIALEEFTKWVDNTVFDGKWSNDEALNASKVLCSFGGKEILQKDFAAFIVKRQNRRTPEDISSYVNGLFKEYVNQSLIDLEDANLEEKHNDFKQIMREYHDGILLFDLTEKNVWNKALLDTTGLKAYYEQHKLEYMWGDRIHADFYVCKDSKLASQTMKLVKKGLKKGIDNQQILTQINVDSQLNLRVISGKFDKDGNVYTGEFDWKTGLSVVKEIGSEHVFVNIKEVLPPQPKELSEIRGIATADYQNYLEKQWIQELRNKYKVEVDEAVLNSIRK